jgi:DivIVA domain-containing protein
MGIFHDDGVWVLIVLAAIIVTSSLSKLVRAVRSGSRAGAIPAEVWSGLYLSVVFLADGVFILRHGHPAWLQWSLGAFGVAGLVWLTISGIVSRRRAGVPWWRFWHVITHRPAAGGVGLGDESYLGPGAAGTLDAGTSGLIERIKHVTFSTTRLSSGYDEEEVDIFLDKLVAVLSENGRLNQAELCDVRFTATRLRPGYVVPDVDSFLREIAEATTARSGWGFE